MSNQSFLSMADSGKNSLWRYVLYLNRLYLDGDHCRDRSGPREQRDECAGCAYPLGVSPYARDAFGGDARAACPPRWDADRAGAALELGGESDAQCSSGPG